MCQTLQSLFPDIESLEIRVQENDLSDRKLYRRSLVFSLDNAPDAIPCHGADCPSGGGFSLARIVRRMVRKGETTRRGFSLCETSGRGERGLCINYFEYEITIGYASPVVAAGSSH